MDDNKQAKLLLLGEEILNVNQLWEFTVSHVKHECHMPSSYRDIFSDEEKLILKIDMDIHCLCDPNVYSRICKAKKLKVILLDEFDNIIKRT